MLGKIARKVYRVLVKRPPVPQNSDPVALYQELTTRTAPNNYGEREEYPELPKPFAPHPTHITLNETTALTQLYTGQKVYVDTRDMSLAPHLMIDGVWEAHVTRAIATLLKEDDIFFDVGANFAYYSCVAATRLTRRHKHINIHAFEPNPALAKLARKTFRINGLAETTRLNITGVSDKPGDLTLYLNDELWGSSGLRKNLARTENATEIIVPVTTIDAYCKAHNITKVDVVKLDIEGYEDHAYAGMRHTLKHNPQLRLVMEFTFGAYENELDFFKQLQTDFTYTYYIDHRGEFELISNFEALRGKTRDDLVMIVLTNKELT